MFIIRLKFVDIIIHQVDSYFKIRYKSINSTKSKFYLLLDLSFLLPIDSRLCKYGNKSSFVQLTTKKINKIYIYGSFWASKHRSTFI